MALRKGPRSKLPSLGEKLADTIEHDRTATQAASETSSTTLVESIPGTSTSPSSYRSALFPNLVPLSRVQKVEAQMATLLHHIHPWMHRSVAEAENGLEHKMDKHTERKIAEVHQLLDAFEFWVLARTAPQVDVSTLQATVEVYEQTLILS